jgi:hypothetical protein
MYIFLSYLDRFLLLPSIPFFVPLFLSFISLSVVLPLHLSPFLSLSLNCFFLISHQS